MHGVKQAAACQECRLGRASRPGNCPFYEVKRTAGSILVSQGSIPKSVWYLRRGQVALSVINGETGDEVSWAIRGPDSVFGAESVFGRPVDYQVRALTDVTACCLANDVFSEWLGPLDSPVGTLLDLALRESQARANDRRALDGRVKHRVARYLVERLDHGDHGELAATPQKVIARTLEMRPETLSRVLAELRRDGALAPGRRLVIVNESVLRCMAEESPQPRTE